jgi:hypothetical protein
MANQIELVSEEQFPCFYFGSCPTDGEHNG